MAFIGEVTEVAFDRGHFEKVAIAPSAFRWRGEWVRVAEVEREWQSSDGKGAGSWGVGRTYFRVRAESGEVFELYYDRRPDGGQKKGTWVLWRLL
jgi:poly(3-hydroxyalkanoate) synthetase